MDFNCYSSSHCNMVSVGVASEERKKIKGSIDPATSRREEKRRRSRRNKSVQRLIIHGLTAKIDLKKAVFYCDKDAINLSTISSSS